MNQLSRVWCLLWTCFATFWFKAVKHADNRCRPVFLSDFKAAPPLHISFHSHKKHDMSNNSSTTGDPLAAPHLTSASQIVKAARCVSAPHHMMICCNTQHEHLLVHPHVLAACPHTHRAFLLQEPTRPQTPAEPSRHLLRQSSSSSNSGSSSYYSNRPQTSAGFAGRWVRSQLAKAHTQHSPRWLVADCPFHVLPVLLSLVHHQHNN